MTVMTIDSFPGRVASHGAGRRVATLATALVAALAGAVALLVGSAAAPAAADTPDPDAPFGLPRIYTSDQPWSQMFPGGAGDDAGYLRTGGVNCPRPDPLPASDAGSGHGYRAPFVMALTDGRALAGYSPLAERAGQFPFGAGVVGVTGWVRGWVDLPSLRVSFPADPEEAVALCPGSGMFYVAAPDVTNVSSRGLFVGVTAATDAPRTDTAYAWSELLPAGVPRASITGLTRSGALEFSASMPVEMHALQNHQDGGPPNDCTLTFDLPLSTATESLPASFPPVEGVLPADPARWRSQAVYNRYYENPFDLKSAPPKRYQMPPRALGGALPGQSATVANATVALPALAPPSPPRAGRCEIGGFGSVAQSALSPLAMDSGSLQPAYPVWPGGTCAPQPCTAYRQWNDLMDGTLPTPRFAVPAGAVQTSVDITITDIGLPQGLPSGYGFSS